MGSSNYDFLKEKLKEFAFLSHARNIIVKKESRDKEDIKKQQSLDVIVENYVKYLQTNIDLHGLDKKIITKRVSALNKYYDFLYENNYDNLYSSQSKFRPTILEEFMGILFYDLIQQVEQFMTEEKKLLGFGSIKAYTNLFFSGKNFYDFMKTPTIGINAKDQDFAVFRETQLNIDGHEQNLCLPVVALENKTYLDKTMLEGAIATAEKIKAGNPYCLFCIVTENYDVSFNVDPAYSRIDQIFVLRKAARRSPRTKIDSNVVLSLVELVSEHLSKSWSDVEQKMLTTGKII